MRKLPPHVYDKMYAMRDEGASLAEIARAVGRHRGTVHKCLTRREKPKDGHIWTSEEAWPVQINLARMPWSA